MESDEEENTKIHLEKKFITSPAEVITHRKVNLQDAEMSERYREQLKLLCKEFEDIISKDSTDIGKTPLITMDVDTGDSPPVCQKPYNLPLKHREWVQKELETLEKAGVIVRSISPWASPIIVVSKKTEPGEPPRRRLFRLQGNKQSLTRGKEGSLQSKRSIDFGPSTPNRPYIC